MQGRQCWENILSDAYSPATDSSGGKWDISPCLLFLLLSEGMVVTSHKQPSFPFNGGS